MDIKRKASEGIVAIPAKKSKNEVALRYGTRSDFDENVSSQHGGAENREIVPEIEYLFADVFTQKLVCYSSFCRCYSCDDYVYVSDVFLQGVKRTSHLQAPIMLLSGHEGDIYCTKFAPSGQFLASAGFDRLICEYLCCHRIHSELQTYKVLVQHNNKLCKSNCEM